MGMLRYFDADVGVDGEIVNIAMDDTNNESADSILVYPNWRCQNDSAFGSRKQTITNYMADRIHPTGMYETQPWPSLVDRTWIQDNLLISGFRFGGQTEHPDPTFWYNGWATIPVLFYDQTSGFAGPVGQACKQDLFQARYWFTFGGYAQQYRHNMAREKQGSFFYTQAGHSIRKLSVSPALKWECGLRIPDGFSSVAGTLAYVPKHGSCFVSGRTPADYGRLAKCDYDGNLEWITPSAVAIDPLGSDPVLIIDMQPLDDAIITMCAPGAGGRYSIQSFDEATGARLWVSHAADEEGLSISSHGNGTFTASGGRYVRLFEWNSNQLWRTATNNGGTIGSTMVGTVCYGVRFFPNGDVLAWGPEYGTVTPGTQTDFASRIYRLSGVDGSVIWQRSKQDDFPQASWDDPVSDLKGADVDWLGNIYVGFGRGQLKLDGNGNELQRRSWGDYQAPLGGNNLDINPFWEGWNWANFGNVDAGVQAPVEGINHFPI